MSAMSIGDFLKMPNAYVISVDGFNIGHTVNIEDVSNDNIHFQGIDKIVEFIKKTDFSEYFYTFNINALINISYENFKKVPLCQHHYTLENIEGEKINIELGFVTSIYPNIV